MEQASHPGNLQAPQADELPSVRVNNWELPSDVHGMSDLISPAYSDSIFIRLDPVSPLCDCSKLQEGPAEVLRTRPARKEALGHSSREYWKQQVLHHSPLYSHNYSF